MLVLIDPHRSHRMPVSDDSDVNYPVIPQTRCGIMTRIETVKYFRKKLSQANVRLEDGLTSAWHRCRRPNNELGLLKEPRYAIALLAANSEARRRWGTIFINEIFK